MKAPDSVLCDDRRKWCPDLFKATQRNMGANMGKTGNGSSLLENLSLPSSTLHIVMLGLDSAGKTTALYRLKFDQYVNTVRTATCIFFFRAKDKRTSQPLMLNSP